MQRAKPMTAAEEGRVRFGEFIARYRRLAGISQTEAGRRAGMSRTQWTRIELGESGTKIDNIEPIANAISADLATAYRLAGFVPPATAIRANDPMTDDAAILFAGLDRIPPERRAYVFEHVRSLIEIELRRAAAHTAEIEEAVPLSSQPRRPATVRARVFPLDDEHSTGREKHPQAAVVRKTAKVKEG